MGLNVNISKTKYMLVSTSEMRRNLYSLSIEGNSFNAVNKFTYLVDIKDNEGCIYTTHDKI